MARLFEEHLTRACACLDGVWRMQADPCDVGESEQWNLGLPNGAFTSVPSDHPGISAVQDLVGGI